MNDGDQIIVFRLDEALLGLRLESVDRVISAGEVVPLPHAPDIVVGVVNVAGEIVPVVNVRRRFGMSDRIITPSDQFILTTAGRRRVAIVVDQVLGVTLTQERFWSPAAAIAPATEYIS